MLHELHPSITRYLNGQMSAAERQDFETRLRTDPELAAEVVLYETLLHQRDQDQRARWQTLGQNLLAGTAPALRVTHRSRYYRLAVAASLALAITAAGFWLYRLTTTSAGEKLYAREASVLHDSGTLGGQGGQDAWAKAYRHYDGRRYVQARQEVAPLLAQPEYRDRAYLLLGFCWLQENDPTQARAALAQVAPKATAYYWQARYGTALAYLRENNLEEAARILKDIAQQSEAPDLRERAIALAEKL